MKNVVKQYFKAANQDFKKFLAQCRYAVNKMFEYNVPTKYD